MSKPVILCVDDENIITDALKDQLQRKFGAEFDIETSDWVNTFGLRIRYMIESVLKFKSDEESFKKKLYFPVSKPFEECMQTLLCPLSSCPKVCTPFGGDDLGTCHAVRGFLLLPVAHHEEHTQV